MEKKEYFAPAVRVRPLLLEGDVMDGITISGKNDMDEDDAFGKETGEEDFDDATYRPYSVWEE